MSAGTGTAIVAGVRLADWAMALTYLLAAVLVLVVTVALFRIIRPLLPQRPFDRWRSQQEAGPASPAESGG